MARSPRPRPSACPRRSAALATGTIAFCWIRDAAFATFALMRLGYVGEAQRFNEWVSARADASEAGDLADPLPARRIARRARDHPRSSLRIPRLDGPCGSACGAASQLQLDIYGALFDAGYLADKYGEPVTYGDLGAHVAHAQLGLPQLGPARRGHLGDPRRAAPFSVVAAHVLGRARPRPAPRAQAFATRRERAAVDARIAIKIYRDIHDNFWNEERGAFVAIQGRQPTLDASALLMPLMRFIAPHDPRWLSTQDAVERELTSDVLVRRYETGDGDDNVDGPHR